MTDQSKKRPEKQAYLRVTRGLLPRPGEDRIADGRQLVRQCLRHLRWRDGKEDGDPLEDQWNYPPRLFVLLATVAFQSYEELLAGIREELDANGLTKEKAPLVGCSVAGVLTEEDVMLQGAALVCIASRAIHARVGVLEGALDHPQEAVTKFCHDFGLAGDGINPHRNRFMLCFVPGYVRETGRRLYKAAEIHEALRDATDGQISMVGGAAGDDFHRENCWLFADDGVDSRSAVVALVDSDLRFGIGMLHGLEPTGEFFYARGVSDDGHHISRFGRIQGEQVAELTPQQLLAAYDDKVLLGGVAPEDEAERIVLYPLTESGGSVFVARPVSEQWPLEVLRCTSEGLRKTPADTIACTIRGGQIDPFHLALALRFPCVARLEYSNNIGLDVDGALEEMRKRFPALPIVAGLVYGEIGLGHSRRNLMRNWSVSNLLLTDELHPHSLHRKGYEARAKAEEQTAGAHSESVATMIEIALRAVVEAGFPGAMISLVFHDRDSYVIVAQDALGEGWKAIVRHTRRKAGDNDILEVVAKTKTPCFIPDARHGKHDHPEAVKLANVISYYVAPLVAPDGHAIGALQVGLGDMSNLREEQFPAHLKTLLDAFAGQIATALSRVIRIHDLRLSELFDKAVKASLIKSTAADAAQEFVDVIMAESTLLGSHMVHIRLLDGSGQHLAMAAGAGKYYELARKYRRAIPLTDPSPTVKALRDGKSTWVNDAEHDEHSQKFVDFLTDTPDLKEALGGMPSYSNLLIRPKDGGSPIGVITIASPGPWFFSESVFRSMQTLGERLYFALQHARQVETKDRHSREIDFLLRMTPQLGADDLRTALRHHAGVIAQAASAQVVSFFLWDPETGRFVLRGQHGWKDPAMLGEAAYRPGEGMTGTIAEGTTAVYIPDLKEWKDARPTQGQPKHEPEMFGKKLPDERFRYEVIAVPLGVYRQVRIVTGQTVYDPLGVLTMQNALERDGPSTGFVTHAPNLLEEVRDDITAFLAASLAHEDALHREKAEARIGELASLLLKPVPDEWELARRVCRHLVKSYDLEGCAIYLPDESGKRLLLAGPPHFCSSARGGADMTIPRSARELKVDGSLLGKAFTQNRASAWRATKEGQTPGDDSTLWARHFLPQQRVQAALAQPIRESGQDPVAVLAAWNIRQQAGEEYTWFTKRDQREFERAGECLARAIEHQRKSREEKWILFLGTVRTHLAHLVLNRIASVQDILTAAYKQVEGSEAAGVLDGASEECRYVLEEMDRCGKAAHRAEPVPYQELSLAEVLSRAAANCRAKAERQGVSVACPPDSGIWIRGDADQLEHAFENVIDNGLNAMGSGELRIAVDISKKTQECVLRFTDQGKGMSPQMIERLLGQPRKLKADRRVPLGVAFVKFVIEHHGGGLDFESVKAHGTTTLITLPYVRIG